MYQQWCACILGVCLPRIPPRLLAPCWVVQVVRLVWQWQMNDTHCIPLMPPMHGVTIVLFKLCIPTSCEIVKTVVDGFALLSVPIWQYQIALK